jgi:hypothetical protein
MLRIDFATDAADLAARNQRFASAKVETVRQGSASLSQDCNLDIENVFKPDRAQVLAGCGESRPSDFIPTHVRVHTGS